MAPRTHYFPAQYPHAVLVRPLIVAGIWAIAAAATVLALAWHGWWAVLLALATLGTWDLAQTRHTILRLSRLADGEPPRPTCPAPPTHVRRR
jgi:hypothetical protein